MSIESRLKILEEKVRVIEAKGIWIEMEDCKVTVSIGRKKNKTLTFPTVFDAGQYVQTWKDKVHELNGVAFISYLPELMYKQDPVQVSDTMIGATGVIVNLAKWKTGNFLDLILISWAHGHMSPDENPFNLQSVEQESIGVEPI